MRNPSGDSSTTMMLILLGAAGYLLYTVMSKTASSSTYAAEQASGQYSTPAQVAAAQSTLEASSGQSLYYGPPSIPGSATGSMGPTPINPDGSAA